MNENVEKAKRRKGETHDTIRATGKITVSTGDGSLVPGWSAEAEAAYLVPSIPGPLDPCC